MDKDKIQGTCSVCLRSIQLHRDRPIRHGFSAVGVRHGQTGGHHTGPCPGTGFRHLEISTEGTQWALDSALEKRARAEDRLRELAGNPDLIWYPRLRGSSSRVPGGIPDTSRPVTLRYAEDVHANDGRPTYASELRRRVVEQTSLREALDAAITEYERVLAHWSPERYPTTGATTRVETVHMEHPVKTVRGTLLGILCRGVSRGRGSLAARTCDPAGVTCKRCRAALGLPPE